LATVMVCETCDFEAPYDRVGVAIMEQHLLSEHGIRTSASQRARAYAEHPSHGEDFGEDAVHQM
jgi:hypothetical protein